jgi:hypothetical protein
LRELRGRFYRLPPKDDSYRSPDWDPGLPVDLPPFLAGILKAQVKDHPRQPCSCASQHEGSGRYVFLGPDGGHYRRSNYSRRVFRPACDGRHVPISGAPGRLVIAEQTTTWPGTPIAAWPPPPRPPAWTPGTSRLAATASRSSPPTPRARWQESLQERAALNPRSLVPLLDELLTPLRIEKHAAEQRLAQRQTNRQRPA